MIVKGAENIILKIKRPKKPTKAKTDVLYIHLFSHTHWDFEWYEINEEIKLQLVPLIEHLLNILEKDPGFKFHFDGQVMPIIDYLEILKEEDDCDNRNRVKEAEERITKYVTGGQLHIGPCWSTPETSLISCESLIRNINRGIRFSKKFGSASSIFYNADAFQYHSQVPQIIEGTGLRAAFTWRAFKQGKTLKDLSIWEGADKSAVVKYHPPRTYAQIWRLPENSEDTMNILKREAEFLKIFAVTSHVLITQGNDQFEAQSDINETINKVNEMIGENYQVSQIALEEFFRIAEEETPELDILQGELTGNQWACTMSGQLSARIYLKQKNKEAEIAIEKWAEPFAVFAWLLGNEYPAGLLERAWGYLMKQHFHHCNACAIDEVHREGEVRYENAIEVAKGLTEKSINRIASIINSADMINEDGGALVIFNPSDVERAEVVNSVIYHGMNIQRKSEWQLDKKDIKWKQEISKKLAIKDSYGNSVNYQILNKQGAICEIAFWAEKIPPLGYKTFGVDFSGGSEILEAVNIANEKQNTMENDLLKIKIKENGSLNIFDKRNNIVFKNQNIIEDMADHGDTYNYDSIRGDKPITSKTVKGKITLKENGPLLATYEVKIELVLPECLTLDRKARSIRLVKIPISFYITLKKESPLVFITAKIDNRIKDHRLRVLFSGVKSNVVYVQTQGDVVKRRIGKLNDYPKSRKRNISHSVFIGDLPKEKGPSATQFQRNFVSINDGKKGLVILNKGLPEYEAKVDGTIALTLLRSVGWLSQDDLTSREKLAGPKVSVPDAQCIGPHVFEYAILPQPGSWDAKPVYREENRYNIDIKSAEIPWQKGKLPLQLSFVLIKPDELMVSAIKKAYSNDNIIIRLFNPTSKYIKGSIEIYPGIKEAWTADLNEEKKNAIHVQIDGTILIEAGPKKIITISILPYLYPGEAY